MSQSKYTMMTWQKRVSVKNKKHSCGKHRHYQINLLLMILKNISDKDKNNQHSRRVHLTGTKYIQVVLHLTVGRNSGAGECFSRSTIIESCWDRRRILKPSLCLCQATPWDRRRILKPSLCLCQATPWTFWAHSAVFSRFSVWSQRREFLSLWFYCFVYRQNLTCLKRFTKKGHYAGEMEYIIICRLTVVSKRDTLAQNNIFFGPPWKYIPSDIFL